MALIVAASYTLLTPTVHGAEWQELLAESRAIAKANPDSAVVLAKLAVEAAVAANGEVDTSVAMCLHQIGAGYHHLGSLETETYYLKALDIWNRAPGAREEEKGKTLSNLGNYYTNNGRFKEAKDVLDAAIEAKAKGSEGYYSETVVRTLLKLADLSLSLNQFDSARAYIEQATQICDSTKSCDYRRVYAARKKLADTYRLSALYKKAINEYAKAIEICRANNDIEKEVTTYINESIAYYEIEDYRTAESLLVFPKEFLESRKLSREDSTAYFHVLNNLGLIKNKLDSPENAERYFKEALPLAEAIFGASHSDYARLLQNVGNLELKLNRPDEALDYSEKALAIRKGLFGPYHLAVIHSLEGKAAALRYLRRHEEALAVLDEAYQNSSHLWTRQLLAKSESDATAISSQTKYAVGRYLSAWMSADPSARTDIRVPLEMMLAAKGVVTDEAIQRRRFKAEVASNYSDSLSAKYQRLETELLKLTALDSLSEIDLQVRDSLNNSLEKINETVARLSGSFSSVSDGTTSLMQPILTELESNDLLLSYLIIPVYNSDGSFAENHFTLSIMGKDVPPQIYDLGPEKQTDSLVEKYRQHMRLIAESGGLPSETELDTYTAIARQLYETLILPASDALSQTKTVHVSADGSLNAVAFGTLVGKDGSYLVERFAINYLTSGRDIIRLQKSAAEGSGLLAVADPAFNAAEESALMAASNSESDVSRALNRDFSAINVRRLPHTRREAVKVVDGWKSVRGGDIDTLFGESATEELLKVSAPGKKVIYIATHGFFLDNEQFRSRPELQSGLLLANANGGIGSTLEEQQQDGILTAYDVSRIDLSGVQLVVLSACESGLGLVSAGEGVYGLRRSFQLAGARTVISSLWSIPDDFTAGMMGAFFSSNEPSSLQSLRHVQLSQLDKLRKAGLPDHPYTWGSFINVGQWR